MLDSKSGFGIPGTPLTAATPAEDRFAGLFDLLKIADSLFLPGLISLVRFLPGLKVRLLPGLKVRLLSGLRVRLLPGLKVRLLSGLRVRLLPGLNDLELNFPGLKDLAVLLGLPLPEFVSDLERGLERGLVVLSLEPIEISAKSTRFLELSSSAEAQIREVSSRGCLREFLETARSLLKALVLGERLEGETSLSARCLRLTGM